MPTVSTLDRPDVVQVLLMLSHMMLMSYLTRVLPSRLFHLILQEGPILLANRFLSQFMLVLLGA